ncbi:MAG: hypothetical protein JXA20_13705 [Spirochaetes bacterium]|nr:hypothetical protein [Spirochaetota bacterium]
MKRTIAIRTCIMTIIAGMFSIAGCASYSIHSEISESAKLEALKKSGIVLRLPRTEMALYRDYARSLQFWLKSYEKQNDLFLLTKAEGNIVKYPSELERFYQISIDGDFMLYKSQGVIRQTLHENEPELKTLMEREGLDSLIIYEVDGDYSTEMQFIDFTSLVTIVDRDLSLLYLDHQANTIDIDEFDHNRAKTMLLDTVSKRLIETLEDLEYLSD